MSTRTKGVVYPVLEDAPGSCDLHGHDLTGDPSGCE